MTRVVCFARLKDPRLFDVVEFYSEDLGIFQSLGFEVQREHRLLAGALSDGDLLYAWWGATALPVVLAWRLRGKRSILTGALGFRDEGEAGLRMRLRTVLTVLASRLASRTLAVSQYELDDLKANGVVGARVAYHAIDTEYFSPSVKTATPRCVTIAHLNQASIIRKGVDISIAATSIVRKVVPEFELEVVGAMNAGGRAWLKRARLLHDFEGISFPAAISRDAKRSALQSAWAYLQPSRYEAFGVAMMEAMACGTPAICSSGGALPEVVGSGGIVLRERTPECLAEEILRLISDSGRRERLQISARARALHFTTARRQAEIADVVLDVYGALP